MQELETHCCPPSQSLASARCSAMPPGGRKVVWLASSTSPAATGQYNLPCLGWCPYRPSTGPTIWAHIAPPEAWHQENVPRLVNLANQDQRVDESGATQSLGTEAMSRSRVGWKPLDCISTSPSVQLMSYGKDSQRLSPGIGSRPEVQGLPGSTSHR